MKVAIFSDVHANLPALETFIERTGHVDRYACLGDTVGYGPWPNECAVLVRELCGHFVCQGNHERLHLGLESIDDQLPIVRAFYRQTLPWFTRTDLITDLPKQLMIGDWIAQHQEEEMTPFAPSAFVGHSHVPVTFRSGTAVTYMIGDVIELGDAAQAVMNVGSVGQPRDEDPRAAFGIFDVKARTLEVHRVEYDVEAAAARIREAGLPEFLGDRLRIGR